MPKAKRLPTHSDAEEARIQAGIARDPDSREASDEQLAGMRPASEVLPPALYAALVRSQSEQPKQEVKLRLDRDAIGAFKQTGPGWQARMSDLLVAAAKDLKRKNVPPDNESVSARRTKRLARNKSSAKAQ